MRKYLDVIKSSRLFRDIDDGEIEAMLSCLSVSSREYAKNEFILRAGERSSSIGLVLAGAVHIIKEDFLGNRNIIAEAQPGEIFAESYACVPGAPLGVSAAAAERSEVMFMDVSRVLTVCGSACAFHARLMRNLLAVLAEKNLQFSEKLTYMTQRSTRQKLLSYLSAESFIGRVAAPRLARIRDTVQPPTARGLPLGGPQRALGRALEAARRRAARLPQEQIHARAGNGRRRVKPRAVV